MNMRKATRLVVIPMKDPRLGKTRLGKTRLGTTRLGKINLAGPKAAGVPGETSAGLENTARAALSIGLFDNLVTQLLRLRPLCRHGFDLATVTASATIATRARQAGIGVIDEGRTLGLNQALQLAAEWAGQSGYQSLAVLPGDLARPLVPDLQALLDRPADPGEAVLCPAKDGGTNALLLPLPLKIGFSYGENSSHSHREALLRAGLRVWMPALTSLKYDVDRPEDLTSMATVQPLDPGRTAQPKALIGGAT